MRTAIEITDGVDRVDFELVHSWLKNSYWSPGMPLEKVRRAAKGSSLVVSAHDSGIQIGYLRVISDRATFAWIADVYVDEEHRGKGIARAMVQYAQAHADHLGLRRWVLATKDAYRVYETCGFGPLEEPHRWMIHFPQAPPAQDSGEI